MAATAKSGADYEKRCASNRCQEAKAKWRHVLTQWICFGFLFGVLYGILGVEPLLSSQIFALFLLATCAHLGGQLVNIIRLPPLIGMLLMGVLFRNSIFIQYHKNITTMWSSTLRDISLVIILLKAGLGLDSKKLAELKLAVLKLSFVPCIVETVSISILAHFILLLPWIWSFMLGFILSAVSAAVVVPGMLKMEDTQLGTQCGIPTLLLASVSVDNIIALTGFMVTYSILTSDESLIWSLIQRPIEPLIGFSLGAVIGIVLWYLPSPNNSKHGLVYYRSLLLVLSGLSFVFISKRCDVAGVGALGCVSLAYVASLKWKEDAAHFKSITWITSLMWSITEPFLFGLIGTEVAYESLGNNIGMSILTLLLGITVRLVATVVSLTGSNFNLKEKAFISASWISKATVQAAVGTQALDFARSHETDLEFVDYSQQILTMAVLSIVITAPLGAAFIDHLAPWLLKRHDIADDKEASEEEVAFFPQVTEINYGSTSSLVGQEKITV